MDSQTHFIGTVEGEPEDTACEEVIDKVKDAGFKKVVLRPLMVVAGDHANNDMAGDDEDSWKSQFEASGAFDSVDCQIEGLGRIAAVEDLYVAHTKACYRFSLEQLMQKQQTSKQKLQTMQLLMMQQQRKQQMMQQQKKQQNNKEYSFYVR